MRRIAHLSDLHFGAHDAVVARALLRDLGRVAPDVVAISGDVTQRARRRQFRKAREWLDRVPAPLIVVPGNHDIPFYDVWRRFLRPLHRFRRFVTNDLAPMHVDDEVAILGLNTARSLALKNGRLSLRQIALIRARFRTAPGGSFRVLVTHHPFVRHDEQPKASVVGRADLARRALEASGVELLLAGHVHLGFTSDMRRHYANAGRSILTVQAGTAMSHRMRGEPNSYNVLDVGPERVVLEVRRWMGRGFRPYMRVEFGRRGGAWSELRRRVVANGGASRRAGTRHADTHKDPLRPY